MPPTSSRNSGSNRKSRPRTRSRQAGRQRKGSSSDSSEPRGKRDRASKSQICTLDFPVARVKTMMKVDYPELRISDKTAVFTTAALEYMTHEILELSLNSAREEDRSRIKTKHVNTAVKLDTELFRNFKNSSVYNSIFIPFDKMVSCRRRTHRVRDPSLPGPSNAAVQRPIFRHKSGSRGLSRRKG